MNRIKDMLFGAVVGAAITATIATSDMKPFWNEQGRTEATSNLVAAIDTLTEKSREELFLRANGVVSNEGLTLGEKMGYLTASFDTIMQLEKVRLEIAKDAKLYASGEKKANTNECLAIPSYDLKINL